MWADSAYVLTPHVIPVHKRPEADIADNRAFDAAVSHIRIRSEHCMGALKGRWQSLHGLRIMINRKRDHVLACDWIRMCIMLHNIVIEMVEEKEWTEHFTGVLAAEEREEEHGAPQVLTSVESRQVGDMKRKALVAAYAALE